MLDLGGEGRAARRVERSSTSSCLDNGGRDGLMGWCSSEVDLTGHSPAGDPDERDGRRGNMPTERDGVARSCTRCDEASEISGDRYSEVMGVATLFFW